MCLRKLYNTAQSSELEKSAHEYVRTYVCAVCMQPPGNEAGYIKCILWLLLLRRSVIYDNCSVFEVLVDDTTSRVAKRNERDLLCTFLLWREKNKRYQSSAFCSAFTEVEGFKRQKSFAVLAFFFFAKYK